MSNCKNYSFLPKSSSINNAECPKCKSGIQIPRHSLIDKGKIIEQIYVCHDCGHDWVWKK